MSGSMSVHSLIDKFSSQEEKERSRSPEKKPDLRLDTNQDRDSGDTSSQDHSQQQTPTPQNQQYQQYQNYHGAGGQNAHNDQNASQIYSQAASTPQLSSFSLAPPSGSATGIISGVPTQKTSSAPQPHPQPQFQEPQTPQMGSFQHQQSLASILGPAYSHIPLTDSAMVVEALRLRTEQEKSRQEQIRLEIANKNHAILQLALQNDVPPALIPSMCVGGQSSPSEEPKQPRPTRADPENASLVAPSNFRFGAGSANQARRPLSPAKIGAAAVANLTNPITPYRPAQKTLPAHQRHFSMPESLGDKEDKHKKPPAKAIHSPSGSTSSIQVKPSPAQPLHKQARTSQPPSQESMTSFQHIIQFQHWRPERSQHPISHERRASGSRLQQQPHLQQPMQPQPQSSQHSRSPSRSHSRRGSYSHKRHRSNDMSVDLGHDDPFKSERPSPDVSMESDNPEKDK